MKLLRFPFLLLTVTFLSTVIVRSEPAATNSVEEKKLIAVLRSTAGPREKDEACARLKRIGTDRSVAALAALLTDEQLSHSARYALESMESPAAGKALVAALGHTSGSVKVGIIDSIAVRGDKNAVPALTKALNDPDQAIACATAAGLGRIGDAAALKALTQALRQSKGAVHMAQARASLDVARAQLRLGNSDAAKAIFESIYRDETAPGLRVAAYRGLIYSSRQQSRALIIKGLKSAPGPARLAALQVLHERDFGVIPDIAAEMANLPDPVQAAIIDGLRQSGNSGAVELARPAMASGNLEVRLAAMRCLGALADTAAIPLLEKPAADASGTEKQLAREALVTLHHGDITDGLIAQLRTADTPTKAEAARALGMRGDTNAMPALLESATGDPDSVRVAASQAVGLLGQAGDMASVVQLVVRAKSDDARSAAVEALNSVLQRLQASHAQLDLAVIGHAVESSSPEARIALLEICSGLSHSEIRIALQKSAHDQDPNVRAAAIRAICDSTDVELLPDLLNFATDKSDEKVRSMAITGCVRLLTQEEGVKVPDVTKVQSLKQILAAGANDAEKRIVLSGLARIPDVESLKTAEPMLADAPVQGEAVQAVIKIASTLPPADGSAAKASLDKVLAMPIDADTRKAATAASKKLNMGH